MIPLIAALLSLATVAGLSYRRYRYVRCECRKCGGGL